MGRHWLASSRTARVVPIVVGAVVAVAVHSRSAEACSPSFCFGGHLVPGDGATAPANLPGLYWDEMRGGDSEPEVGKVTLTTVAAPDVALPLTAALGGRLLVPGQPLVPGTSYIASDANVCREKTGPRVVFTVGPAAAVPAHLGTLRAVADGVGALDVAQGASCSTQVRADLATIQLDVAPEAAPWFDVLQFQTWVDGKLWSPKDSSLQNLVPGTSWRGRGADLVYRVCGASSFVDRVAGPSSFMDPGLGAGKHKVTMHASVPGMPGIVDVMSSSAEVELACPEDGGCSVGGSPTAAWWVIAAIAGVAYRRRRRAAA